MRFFVDTADVDQIRKANDMGVICGVTTNPSLIAKSGRQFEDVIKEITSIVDGAISGEVKATTTDAEGMIKEGRDIALANVFFQPFLTKLSSKFRHHVIVLMPSSKEKMLERGFLPVREMLKNCPLAIWEPFYKVNNTKQSMQSFENRQFISQVIKRKENETLPGRKLLLVDDVCTSGFTLLSAYHLLKEHKLKVEALVLCAHPLFVESCDEKGLLRKGSFSIL